jgi:hypothetical protein
MSENIKNYGLSQVLKLVIMLTMAKFEDCNVTNAKTLFIDTPLSESRMGLAIVILKRLDDYTKT